MDRLPTNTGDFHLQKIAFLVGRVLKVVGLSMGRLMVMLRVLTGCFRDL